METTTTWSTCFVFPFYLIFFTRTFRNMRLSTGSLHTLSRSNFLSPIPSCEHRDEKESLGYENSIHFWRLSTLPSLSPLSTSVSSSSSTTSSVFYSPSSSEVFGTHESTWVTWREGKKIPFKLSGSKDGGSERERESRWRQRQKRKVVLKSQREAVCLHDLLRWPYNQHLVSWEWDCLFERQVQV